MIARLPRGRSDLRLDLRGLRVRSLEPSAPASGQPQRVVGEALDRPVTGSSLTLAARDRSDAVVIVPDATRRADLPAVLPEVIDRLTHAGLRTSSITMLIACGTHPPAPDAEVAELLGPLPGDVTVVQHDARDPLSLIEVGSPHAHVLLNRVAVKASFVMTVSSVRHHYFAGFGGGPKMIFPGIGGYDQIQANHARVMHRVDDDLRRDPRCEPGVLDGNPVAAEIARLAAVRPADAALCTVPARDGRAGWAVFADQQTAFERAVAMARAWYEIDDDGPFPMVVASAGGHPTDHTLIQAHKALDAASRFLEPEGELLFIAALDGGGGSPDIEPFLDDPDRRSILARLDRSWIQYGHTVLRLVEKTSRWRVSLDSDLDSDVATRLGFHPVDDPARVVARWRQDAPGQTVAVMAGDPVYPAPDDVDA